MKRNVGKSLKIYQIFPFPFFFFATIDQTFVKIFTTIYKLINILFKNAYFSKLFLQIFFLNLFLKKFFRKYGFITSKPLYQSSK